MSYLCWILILIFTTVCIKQSDAECNGDSNGTHHFGPDCSSVCHCMNNSQCDVSDGECPNGCDFNWVGGGCQYENIAIGQYARQIDNMSPARWSNYTNDRNLSTCSYTGNRTKSRNRNPWWRIWFPNNFTMWKMEILTIDSHRQDFKGFNVKMEYVPEDKRLQNGYYPSQTNICYQHNDTVPQSRSMTIKCKFFYTGNQIRIQLAIKTSQLVLCDVRIFGDCKSGEWGIGCTEVCGHCKNGDCDKNDGSCSEGCEPGYKSTRLCNTECRNGTFGINCTQSCSNNCNDVCDKGSGTCSSCKPGWKGVKCLTECPDGYYGNSCMLKCSLNCDGGYSSCDKVSGSCLSGCMAGWTGRKCEQACQSGSWGLNCTYHCGRCQSKGCRSIDGVCDGLCADGFKNTPHCVEECDVGTYGINCSHTCSNNCQDVCNKENGECDHCKSGWYGKMCTVVVECTEKATGINLSAGAFVGTVVALIVVVAVLSSLVTVFIPRRKICAQLFRSRQKAEKTQISSGNAIATELAEADSAYETIRNRENEHEYEMKGN